MNTVAEVQEDDDVWTSRCAVLNKAWVQLRYHRARQRFFDLIDKFTKAATVLLGATIFGQALKEQQPYMAAAISALGFLALVYTYSDRKQLHKELGEAAAKLIADIEQVPAGELIPVQAAGWRAEYARLCAKAPPPLKMLTLICERDQAIVEGHPNHVKIPWWLWPRIPLRHFW